MLLRLLVVLVVLLPAGCGSDSETSPAASDATAHFVFDPQADLTDQAHFFDMPWPSDTRLVEGHPDVRGFPSAPLASILTGLLEIAPLRRGWPVLPVGYLRFSSAITDIPVPTPYPAESASPILLVDVDAQSPELGRLIPTVAQVLEEDPYVTGPMLAVAAQPGFVLRPDTTYAFVATRDLGDAEGAPLGRSAAFESVKPGGSDAATELGQLFAPVWEALASHGVEPSSVAAATVFTTGDVVRDVATMSDQLLAKHQVEIASLAIDPDDGSEHERFCELHGQVRFPQFQRGTPPFESDGLFELGADGLPVVQREEVVPVVVTIPKATMPADGYPLMVYFHGSGGLSDQVVDRPIKGKGPADVVAAFGIGTASSALPVNPERVPGAEETAYLNLNNPKAFPFTFQQGVFEQRMFIEALRKLRISSDDLIGCDGATLPSGVSEFRFAEERLTAMGQSMGGMYLNLIAPMEPRIRTAVPTGAGGYWSYFILRTSLIPGAATLLKLVVDTDATLTFLHPTLSLLTLAWEPAEPMVYMPRISQLPLPGQDARSIFEPVGITDSYFPNDVYDAVAIAYGNQQAGTELWTSMQGALTRAGDEGLASYPVELNRTSSTGTTYTGAVVQYERGDNDTHDVAFKLDEVKHQYGCFIDSYVRTGVAVLPAPGALDAACASE